MNRETVFFCMVPTFGVAVGTFIAFFFGQTLATSPVVVLVSALLGVSSVSVFLAHFSKNVSNSFAWLTIFANGAMMILFFTSLHGAMGILCTSPICIGTQEVTFILQDASPVAAKLDTSFLSSLYFSVVTFTTLGYGDFQPHPDLRIIAALEAILGYVYLGLTVGAAIDLGSRA